MILCDTGPLFALVDKEQEQHTRCKTLLSTLKKPLLTTWVCFAEAMHLAQRAGGWPMQRLLWGYVKIGAVQFHTLTDLEEERMQELMDKYQDAPMDLGDASLVATAEVLNASRIFTLDRHFHAYRLYDKKPFEVVS